MNRKFKRISVTILLTIIYIIGFPVNNIQAANTPKEEVVYANLSSTGTVDNINVVNIFETNHSGVIVDYGSYQNIRNMTGTEEIQSTQDKITINSIKEEKLFYEGHLENSAIPWNFKLTYFLNGIETTPQEIAGKDGLVEIHLVINQNKNCSGNFFDKYALQANITLNSEKFKNIISNGATIANVGKNKQLTYTIFPGKGIDTTIKANVTDFELEAININGIPLNLEIDIDKTELTDKVNQLNNALNQLNNGSNELTNGITTLEDKINQELLSGTRTLYTGSTDLKNGINQARNGADNLNNGTSELEEGASSLTSGLTELKGGIDQIQTGLETLNNQSTSLTGGSREFKNALKQLQEAVNSVNLSSDDLTQLSQSSTQIRDGITQLEQGILTLDTALDSNQYKEILSQNGIDVDKLQLKNQETINTLNEEIKDLNSQIEKLEEQGLDVSALKSQVEQLQGIIQLLTIDSSVIESSFNYLDSTGEQAKPLVEGVETLNKNYQIFDESIQNLASELTSLLSQMTQLTEAVNTLVKEYDKLDNGITDYTEGVSQILAGFSKVSEGSTQLVDGSTTLENGIQSLHSGTNSLLLGMNELNNGSNSLNNGIGTLENGVVTLNNGTVTLLNGSKQLREGTSELKNNTNGIDKEITNKIDETINSLSGNNIPVQSFVSEKNTNIRSVQFVIKTEPIKVEKTEISSEPAKNDLNFWQKLLKLFGLYQES